MSNKAFCVKIINRPCLPISKGRLYTHKEVNVKNKYESVIIINPSVDDEKLKALEAKFTELINNDGKLTKIDELGKRKLAYDVKKNKEGIYVVLYFEANPTLIAELERIYRITDEVIKFIDVRVEE